jgi:hypothetical protein
VASTVTRDAVARGDAYHVTNLNGVKNVAFQRFVRVKAGTHPKFKVTIKRPVDYCTSVNIPSSGVIEDCNDASKTRHWTIGTNGRG